jgi:hypothetical protein
LFFGKNEEEKKQERNFIWSERSIKKEERKKGELIKKGFI